MNTIAKISAASALALGFGVAHASILDPSSGGDILLFGEVLNGTTVTGSYAGDSGILIGTTLTTGTLGNLSTAADPRLAQFIAAATASGATVEWAVQGGKVTTSGAWTPTDQFVTTVNATTAQLALRTGTNTTEWSTGLTNTINTIDATALTANGNNSIFATSIAAGGLFDTSANSNIANWYANGTATYASGLGTSTTLYSVTEGSIQAAPIVIASLGSVSLTATGLAFTAGSTSTVPLPAAIWLLGSGLLGLAGVGRRKTAAV